MDFQECIPDAIQAPSFHSRDVALSLKLVASYWLVQQKRQLEDLLHTWIFSQIVFLVPQRHHIISTAWEVVSPNFTFYNLWQPGLIIYPAHTVFSQSCHNKMFSCIIMFLGAFLGTNLLSIYDFTPFWNSWSAVLWILCNRRPGEWLE